MEKAKEEVHKAKAEGKKAVKKAKEEVEKAKEKVVTKQKACEDVLQGVKDGVVEFHHRSRDEGHGESDQVRSPARGVL